MRSFLRTFSEGFLHPKTIFIFSFVVFATGIPYFLLSQNIEYLKVSASISGLLGTVLASRTIARKGFSEIIYDSRHSDWGDFSKEKTKEDLNVEWDAEVTAMGSVVVLISAFTIFLLEIVEAYK